MRIDRALVAESEGLRQEIRRLRQGLWDVYAVLGFDTDGDPTPDALKHPDIVKLVVDAATETRGDMDELLTNSTPPPPSH